MQIQKLAFASLDQLDVTSSENLLTALFSHHESQHAARESTHSGWECIHLTSQACYRMSGENIVSI